MDDDLIQIAFFGGFVFCVILELLLLGLFWTIENFKIVRIQKGDASNGKE